MMQAQQRNEAAGMGDGNHSDSSSDGGRQRRERRVGPGQKSS